MARRVENECAYCAETLKPERGIVGEDWKLYCSGDCAACGEALSRWEMERMMSVAIPSRHYDVSLEQAA